MRKTITCFFEKTRSQLRGGGPPPGPPAPRPAGARRPSTALLLRLRSGCSSAQDARSIVEQAVKAAVLFADGEAQALFRDRALFQQNVAQPFGLAGVRRFALGQQRGPELFGGDELVVEQVFAQARDGPLLVAGFVARGGA